MDEDDVDDGGARGVGSDVERSPTLRSITEMSKCRSSDNHEKFVLYLLVELTTRKCSSR